MKALILGCGSIGLRHIAHLRLLGLANIEVSDPDLAAGQRAKEKFGITVSLAPEEALQKNPDIVLVCTPAAHHIPMALKALDAGAHVFIEKPLSTNLAGLDLLIEKARRSRRTIQIGYNLRYHPAIRALKRLLESGRSGKILSAHVEFGLYLPKWWPNRDYRQSYMADADLSGGLLFDVSHEIDLLMWFLGEVVEVAGYAGKLSTLKIHGFDLIKVLMKMASGAVASLHIDCLQPTYSRAYSLMGEDTCIRWDCCHGRADKSLGRLLWFDSKSNRYQRVSLRGRPEDTYLDELRDFLQSVKTGKPPLVGLQDGIAVLRVASEIQEAIQTGRARRIDGCSQL